MSSSPTMPIAAVDARRITVSYGAEPVLRQVSLTAAHGVVTGLIGPNGAGKSTLLRTVLGLVRPDGGSVSIEGRAPSASRRSLAYLPQRATSEADYPIEVRELVGFGRLPHLGLLGRRRPSDEDAIDAAIARVGLGGLGDRPLGRLSGGQRQRAHVARTLAQRASVYVLDEPFAGVDAPTVSLMIAVFRELAADGSAVLVVVHDLTLLGALCDEVVLIDRTVLDRGPVEQVLAGPALARGFR